MVILRTRNKITDFLMILAWASPFKEKYIFPSRQNSTVKEYSYQRCHYINIEPPGVRLVPV